MTRSVFFGFGAFVGSMSGPTTCAWWPDDPARLAWDPAKLIPVDLGKNPEAVRQGLIKVADIQCDDFTTDGGLTKIGPRWPLGTTTGACWLEEAYWKALAPAIQPARIPNGVQCRPYELCSVLYWDGPLAGRRFIGFYGEIKSTSAANAMVELWNPATSLVPGQPSHGTFWLNLSTQAMAIEPGFTEIGTASAAPQKGAVFVEATVANAIRPMGPKWPIWLGEDLLPSVEVEE
jgi:hypothetical protein